MEGGTRVGMQGSPSQYDTSFTCRLTDLSVQREDKQTDASRVNVKSGLYNSDKGWIRWGTAAYYMTVLCSAGCFCYYRGNDTQWTGAGARGIRLQLKEWIITVRMNPNSSSLLHNLKIFGGIWSVREAEPKLRGTRRGTLDVIFVFFHLILLPRSDITFSDRICPISEQNQLGVVTPQRPSERKWRRKRGGGWWSGITWAPPPFN